MGKRYKCPYCELRDERKKLIIHIDKRHEEMLPEGYDGARIMYDKINHTDGHGNCRVCKKPTSWNYKAQRYDTLCSNPKCKEAMREEYKKNMLRVRGTYNILNDPQQQEKMLANRSISGKYKFRDGGIVTYTASYEKKFVEFIDNVMEISSKDILMPGPTIEYWYKGEKHFYITDCLYIPFNAIIEIKDGGNNPNNKSTPGMIASREKTVQKEKIITDRGEYNYIRLTNNEFTQLIEFFMEIKEKMLNDDPSMTVRIHETSVSSELNKNYKTKGKKSLSDFKCIKINEDNIKQFKELKHLRTKNCDGYMYLDGDNLACFYNTEHKDNGEYWIQAIEVLPLYKNYSLGTQLLKKCESLGTNRLSVNKSNKVAINMYKKNGWKEYDNSDSMIFMSKGTIKESYLEESSSNKLYFISEKQNLKKLEPRIPNNFFTKNGYEDSKTPRVCFSTDIGKCLSALSMNCANHEYYVYSPAKDYKVITPTQKQVPDAKITDEKWITKPVELICIGKILCTGDNGKDGMPFKYGNNTAELYNWEWKWVEKYNNIKENCGILQESKKQPYAIITDNITITKSYGYTSPKNGIYNAIVDVNASIRARGRSELLVIKNDEVYLSKSKKGLCGNYSIPGGGWDLNESHDKSAIREAEEEARLKTKNVKYADRYLSLYDEPHDWIKREIPEAYQWRGYYTEVYVGEYTGKYSGKIEDADKDDIIKTGKFYKIKDVFDELHPIHQNAILNYLTLPKNESDNSLQGSYILENSHTKNIKYVDYGSIDAKKYIESDSFLKRTYRNRQNEYNGEIAVDGDNVVGYVFIGDKTDKGFINSLFVDSKYRKHGIATRLFNDAIHKYGGYDLTVKKNNKIAIEMYKNKGFVFVGDGNSSSEYYMKLKSHLSNDEKKMVLDESYLLEDSIDSINKAFVDDFKKYINENPKGHNKEIKPLGTPITYTAKKKNEKWLLLATYNGELNKKTSSSFLPQLQKNVKYNGESIEYHTCYLPGDIYIFIKLPNGGR